MGTTRGESIHTPFNSSQDAEKIKRLLTRISVIRGGCDLDLLVFLHRHPSTLLTSEQLAAFVGHDMKPVGEALDAFVAAGFVERIDNATHAASMTVLVIHGPQGKGLEELLEVASTRQGRHQILKILGSSRSRAEGRANPVAATRGELGLINEKH